MPKFMMIAFTTPTEGQEEEFNAWYNETHVPELLAVPGFVSGKRLKVVGGTLPEGVSWQYLAVYEIEADELPAVLGKMRESIGPIPACFDTARSNGIFAVELPD
jgi:hypothetical protein